MVINIKGYKVLIDDEDYEKVNKHKWRIHKDFKNNDYKYVRGDMLINGKKKSVFLHRFLMNFPEKMVVDHVDGNHFNNQKFNLRICNQHDNMHNSKKPKNNTSGYKGVFFNKKAKKYIAQTCLYRKIIYLGSFSDPIQAHEAYKAAAVKYFGEFARFE